MYNQVCWVCLPKRDGMEPIGGELALSRRRFLLDQRHAVSLDRDQNIKGFKGHVKGKIGKRRFYWRARVTGTSGGEIAVEEAFGNRNGWTVVVRDMYGVIVSRSFFDKQHKWLRTEYYEPWDTDQAKISFSPGSESGTILRRDWEPEGRRYLEMTLYTVPYRAGTASQSVVDAQLGEPQLVLVMTEGELCCCSKEEAKARQEAMKNVNSGTVVLMPAWEIKGGELVREDGADGGGGISFTSLEEYAKIEPGSPEKPVPAQEGKKLPEPMEPEPVQPEPPSPAPPQPEPSPEPPAAEPHRARHMQGSVNFEELIDEPLPVAPPVPAVPRPARRMEPEALIPELESATAAAVPAPQPPAPAHMQPEHTEPAFQPEPVPQVPPMPAPQPAPQPMPQPVPQPVPEPPMPIPRPRPEENPDGDADLESILAEAALYGSPPALPNTPPETAGGKPIPNGYTGDIKNGNITGRGRTEQRSGLTSYEGDYVDGRRQGFGTYYYKDGNLCYAGSWKDDRRDGLGVSFRDSDHALHVATWRDGQPQGLVTLFDAKGNLRFSGRMESGKKEGAGVTINAEDGTVFVGQYSGGEATGLGSAFDRDGRLIYYGGWRDGKRHGHGTEFDVNGGVVFDGEFRDGKYYNGVLYQKM